MTVLTSDWLPGSGRCGPSAPPPPAWSAPPPAAAACLASAAACWPGWSPAAGPPSHARAAWNPGHGLPLPAPTSSRSPAVLAGAVCSAPWRNKVQGMRAKLTWCNFVLPPDTRQTIDVANKFIVSILSWKVCLSAWHSYSSTRSQEWKKNILVKPVHSLSPSVNVCSWYNTDMSVVIHYAQLIQSELQPECAVKGECPSLPFKEIFWHFWKDA